MGTNFAVAPGEYLQEWIDGNGMSVGEFAVELGVTVAEIEDLLTGKEASRRVNMTFPSCLQMQQSP